MLFRSQGPVLFLNNNMRKALCPEKSFRSSLYMNSQTVPVSLWEVLRATLNKITKRLVGAVVLLQYPTISQLMSMKLPSMEQLSALLYAIRNIYSFVSS